MENINKEVYDIELDGKIFNAKDLYEIVVKAYSKSQNEFDINIKGENYKFKFKKIPKGCYEAEFHSVKIILQKKEVKFIKDKKSFSFNIYCYNNLISILKYYNFVDPIFNIKNKKIKINMDKFDGDINSVLPKAIIEEEFSLENNNYLITKEKYQSEKEQKIEISHLEKNEETLTLNKLGKYAKNYIQGIKDNENLFYLENNLMDDFQQDSTYFGEFEDIGIFNFLTGSEKTGKTFSLLCLGIYEFEENYWIYLNDRHMTELEHEGKYNEILNIFFYEISKIFLTYDDYEKFSKKFLKIILEKKKFSYKLQRTYFRIY